MGKRDGVIFVVWKSLEWKLRRRSDGESGRAVRNMMLGVGSEGDAFE